MLNLAQGSSTNLSGFKPEALLLPALSSIAMRSEMDPLAERLGSHLRCVLMDWPGFGGAPEARAGSLTPDLLDRFLDQRTERLESCPAVGIAAGHGAIYLAKAARRHPNRFAALVLIAPTWRGPLPTMTQGRRPELGPRIRAAFEMPVFGRLLFRANLNPKVVRWMMREHVYSEPERVTPELVSAKLAAARRPGARFATAAFVTGALDPVSDRNAYLALFESSLPPVLMLRPRAAPKRSGAEMDALAATGWVDTVTIDGALAAHEEAPDDVAAAILNWLPSHVSAAA